MATEKVTIMVLKVDLQCYSCYKKTKKTLCKYPQVRDQIYDEKANTVTITVVCCSPEKIRDKLCCSGGKAIKSIEIKKPSKPNEQEKQPEKPKEAEKPKNPEKPKVAIIEPNLGEKPKEAGKPKPNGAEKPAEKPTEALKAEPVKNSGGPGPVVMPLLAQPVKGPEPVPANGVPSVFPYVGPSYDGYGAGPYYHGYGFPAPPPQHSYDGYYGHVHGYEYGYGYEYDHSRVANVNRIEHYFSEEEPQTCSIM
ncbi:hypothetical protein CASFOL_031676 [Castilleja foliolosa]|uniref:Uncharacterized protein n=1 Tax=Castilleja foliolosa TaxID=1961234 RepID=A0ABD3C676_9LAMI